VSQEDAPGADAIAEAVRKAVAEQLAVVVEDLTAIFGARHDATNERLAKLEEQMDTALRLGIEIRRGTGFAEYLAELMHKQTSEGQTASEAEELTAQTPRPASIDEACDVAPGGAPKRVNLRGFRGLTVYPEPGADPKQAWQASVHSYLNGSRRDL
jgi:hypothetical protein